MGSTGILLLKQQKRFGCCSYCQLPLQYKLLFSPREILNTVEQLLRQHMEVQSKWKITIKKEKEKNPLSRKKLSGILDHSLVLMLEQTVLLSLRMYSFQSTFFCTAGSTPVLTHYVREKVRPQLVEEKTIM